MFPYSSLGRFGLISSRRHLGFVIHRCREFMSRSPSVALTTTNDFVCFRDAGGLWGCFLSRSRGGVALLLYPG